MKTFVITGADGFIASHLMRHLANDGNRIIKLSRDARYDALFLNSVDVVSGELEDMKTCERLISHYEPDGVFHLAAQALVGIGKRDPFNTLESNVRGTYNLLEAFRRYRKEPAKLVVASSDKAYGELPVGSSAYTEDMPLEGRGIYDVSKSCTDLIAQSYGISYSLPIAIIRAGNVYGPGDTELTRIVPSMCDDVINRRPLTILSDGSPVREYLHVDDVCRGYIAAYEKSPHNTARAYNLGTGHALSVAQLAVKFRDDVVNRIGKWPSTSNIASQCELWTGRFKTLQEPEILFLGVRKGEINRQVLDPTRANTELGWKARRSLEDGLKETLIDAFKRSK